MAIAVPLMGQGIYNPNVNLAKETPARLLTTCASTQVLGKLILFRRRLTSSHLFRLGSPGRKIAL